MISDTSVISCIIQTCFLIKKTITLCYYNELVVKVTLFVFLIVMRLNHVIRLYVVFGSNVILFSENIFCWICIFNVRIYHSIYPHKNSRPGQVERFIYVWVV